MDPTSEELALVRKLATTWHLNVPERRKLPAGQVKVSLLLDAIETELREKGWYPEGVSPMDDFNGGLIELTFRGACSIHWKTQVSLSQYESANITKYETPREAAEAYLRTLFGAEIDGIPIDWQSPQQTHDELPKSG